MIVGDKGQMGHVKLWFTNELSDCNWMHRNQRNEKKNLAKIRTIFFAFYDIKVCRNDW
jgi:hypothetical protein